jgi:hypothetical protein
MKRKNLVAVTVVAMLAWFVVANPFNWFVRRSSHFSLERFLEIQKGVRIEEAIAKLGAPIDVVHSRADLGCPGCTAYYFLGDPPPWLFCFDEAWLLVDNQGLVVAKAVNKEP